MTPRFTLVNRFAHGETFKKSFSYSVYSFPCCSERICVPNLKTILHDIRLDHRQLAAKIESEFPLLLDDPKGLEECLYWGIRTFNQEVVATLLSEHRPPMLDHQLQRADALVLVMRHASLEDTRVSKQAAAIILNSIRKARVRTVCSIGLPWVEVARVLIQELKRDRQQFDDTHTYTDNDLLRMLGYEARNGAISKAQLLWFLETGIRDDDIKLLSVVIRHPLLADTLAEELRFAYQLDKTKAIRGFWALGVLPERQMQQIGDEVRPAKRKYEVQEDCRGCPSVGLTAAAVSTALVSLLFWYASVH